MTDALIHAWRCERCGRSYSEAAKRLLAAGEAPCAGGQADVADVAALVAAARNMVACIRAYGASVGDGARATCDRIAAALAPFRGTTDAG